MFWPWPDQLDNLRRNLALALATGKPPILHCRSRMGERDAQDALVAELRAAGFDGAAGDAAFGDRPRVIVHSFSGPVDYAREMLALGGVISFSGLVFRKGEEASADVAPLVPAAGSWSRPTRRSSRRRAATAAGTRPSSWRSRHAGWQSDAGWGRTASRRSGTGSSPPTTPHSLEQPNGRVRADAQPRRSRRRAPARAPARRPADRSVGHRPREHFRARTGHPWAARLRRPLPAPAPSFAIFPRRGRYPVTWSQALAPRRGAERGGPPRDAVLPLGGRYPMLTGPWTCACSRWVGLTGCPTRFVADSSRMADVWRVAPQ